MSNTVAKAKPVTPATRSKVEKLLREGARYADIRQSAKVSDGYIHKVASEIGHDKRRAKAKTKTRERVHAEVKNGGSYAEVASRLGMAESTVYDHARLPLDGSADSPSHDVPFPESVTKEWKPFLIDRPGHWLVIGDIHLPCHDRKVIELAVRQAKRDGAVGVLLNGDVMDCHELSTHDKDPSMPRYVEEVRMGRQLLAWMRAEFPKARLIYKQGNHESRLNRYVSNRAPAIEALEGVGLPSILKTADHGVEVVSDKTIIRLGKLNVIHGHEYKGAGGVNPARWLYLRARSVAMTSHFHRTSEHHAKDISGRHEAAWSLGCACELHPDYAILNEWNHGFAMVETDGDGGFVVRNMRVLNGKVV